MSNYSKRYSEDFKDSLVAIYNSEHRSMNSLSKEYDVTVSTISNWVKNRQVLDTGNGSVTVHEFKKLQKELEQVRRECDILKEAAIILGKHSPKKKS